MWNLIRRVFISFVVTLAAPGLTFASRGEVTDQAGIRKMLGTIPFADATMPYKTLEDRLPKLGMSVKMITYGPVSEEEVNRSSATYKRGDVLYMFFTTSPNETVTRICPIWNSFGLVRRRAVWIPDDRTANFLLNNKCVAP